MNFKEMDPDVVRSIIADQEDILTPLAKQREDRYRRLSCPCCQGKNLKPLPRTDRSGELIVDGIIPHHRFVCQTCDCVYDPESNLVIRDGNPPADIILASD